MNGSLSVRPVARVMIAQWENECISLSVLSMARFMIAQWKNECISLSVLPVARFIIAQWENVGISLAVLSVARVTVAQFNSRRWQRFSTDFFLADHTFCLEHSLGRLKARPAAETVVESRVVPPCGKLLPISNDGPNKRSSGEMSACQDGLWRTEKRISYYKGVIAAIKRILSIYEADSLVASDRLFLLHSLVVFCSNR